MQKFLWISLIGLLSITNVLAQRSFEVSVFDLKATEFVDSWRLITEREDETLILDCTSFLNGLRLYQKNREREDVLIEDIYLHHHECQNLGENIYQFISRDQPVCLRVFPTLPDFQISKDWKHCRSDFAPALKHFQSLDKF